MSLRPHEVLIHAARDRLSGVAAGLRKDGWDARLWIDADPDDAGHFTVSVRVEIRMPVPVEAAS